MNPAERWPGGVRISKHAHSTMARRAVDPEDVGAALRDPEQVSPDGTYERFFRGPLCVVVATEGGVGLVLTVLLRGTRGERWNDDDMAAAMTAYRDATS